MVYVWTTGEMWCVRMCGSDMVRLTCGRDTMSLTCGGDMVSSTCGGDTVSLTCDDKIQWKWEVRTYVLYECVIAHVYMSICVLSPGCNRPPTSPWSSPSMWIPQSTSGTRRQETDKFNCGTVEPVYNGTQNMAVVEVVCICRLNHTLLTLWD